MPENRANQILSGLVFFRRVLLVEKISIGRLEALLGIPFGSNPTLRKDYQSAADREVAFFRNAADFRSQGGRNANALA